MKPAHCLLLVLAFAGCFASGTLGPGQLTRLDGYDAKDKSRSTRELEMVNGRRLIFKAGTTLTLDVPGRQIEESFDSIRVHDDVFDGRTPDGRQFQIPLSQISSAAMDGGQPGTVVGVLIGVVVALAIAVVVVKTEARPIN